MRVWLPTIRSHSGTDIYTSTLARQLELVGHDAIVSWFPHAYELCPWLLKTVTAPKGTDLIHGNSWSGFAFHRTGIPLVVTAHHCVHDPAYKVFSSAAQIAYYKTAIRQFERASFRRAAHVIAVSDHALANYQCFFTLSASSRIYPGVDPGSFPLTAPRSRRVNEPCRMLFVGNPSRRKGFDLLPPLMRRLGDGYQLRFTAGRGRSEGALPSNMTSMGRLEHAGVLQAYRDCDVVVYPSRYEGFGYVVAEAMLSGRPVITCGGTSIEEIITPEMETLTCRSRALDDLERAVRAASAFEDPATLLALREWVVDRFSAHRTADEIIAVYRSLIGPG